MRKMYQFTFSLGCAVSHDIHILKKRETFHFCVAFSARYMYGTNKFECRHFPHVSFVLIPLEKVELEISMFYLCFILRKIKIIKLNMKVKLVEGVQVCTQMSS